MCLVKGKIRNLTQDNITFFSTYRWNRRENYLSYLWNSCSLRSQPYRYKYSYLLCRYKLHRFRKEEGHSRRYLRKRNKWEKNCNLYSNCVYIQNTSYVYENKWASNFVLESLNFFFKRSHSGTIIFTKYWYLKIKINVEHGKIFTRNRAFSSKMHDFFRKDSEHILTSL